mgnify:CR=1 FL=1
MNYDVYSDLITVDELCDMLNIGKNTAYRLLNEKKIKAFRIGRSWKISRQSVIDYIYNSNICND